MASSLASQLSQIAAKSTNPLNLKSQRISHSHSLIFDRKVAGSQDFDTIYQICYDGFRELCLLDARFAEFERTIFSEQSKTEDRTEMSAAQNKELDTVLEAFLALVGGQLLLTPAVAAVDWLVRRFRVHEYNTSCVLLTFLPYHTTPIFLNLLSILPEDLTPTFKVLNPYKRGLINPPRHPLVHSASTNQHFLSALNIYVLQACRQHAGHHALLGFWAGIITEAVDRMLDSARSGRREAEKVKHEDIILRILPVLNEGFSMRGASELVICCYMVSVVLAQKATLSDEVLDGLMEAIVGSWTDESVESGLVCLAVVAQQKPDSTIPKRAFRAVLRLDKPLERFVETATQCPVSRLLLGVMGRCLEGIDKQEDADRLDLLSVLFDSQLLGETETVQGMTMVLRAVGDANKTGKISLNVQTRLAELVQNFSRSEALQPIFKKTLEESSIDVTALEHKLQTVIEAVPAPRAIEDVQMDDVEPASEDTFSPALESLMGEKLHASSFLVKQTIPTFDKLVQVFALATGSQERLDSFVNLPVLGKKTEIPFLSFFIRVVAGQYPIGTKVAALRIISSALPSSSSELDFQALLPFLLVALSDPSEKIRRETAGILTILGGLYKKSKKDDGHPWAHDSWYGQDKSSKISWLSHRDAQKILSRALLLGLEEYILDSSHIGRVLESTLRGSPVSDDSGASELKKSLRLGFFNFLCSHAVNMPVFAPKLGLLKLLNRIDKAGGTTRTKELQPMLGAWRNMSEQGVAEACETERISISDLDHEIVATVTPKEKDAINLLLSNVTSGSGSLRPAFVTAVFDRMKEIWGRVTEERQVAASEQILDISLGILTGDSALIDGCRDVLRSVQLSGTVLVHFLQNIPSSVTDMQGSGPAPKRRRTSQNNMVAMTVKDEAQLNTLMEKMTFILELVDSSAPELHPELASGLFQTLAALHHFKSQIHSGLSYLLSLTLGSLLAIVNRSKTNAKPLFDTSVVRADLVVDCIRTTESPQVQNAALLLVAGLSSIVPELVLHSVMPIFTFMGSTVLKKDDDYSVSVIDQTIDQVVPALIQSLRNQKRDIVSGTSELLLSFTAAFEHIPSHRRLRLFHALITKLGIQDFLFAVLAMLANRYGMDKDVLTLMSGLVSDADAPAELTTYSKYLNLVIDSLKPKPGISQVLLGIGSDDGREPQKVATDLLRALAHLFKYSTLKTKIAKAFASDEEASVQVRSLFSRILEQILSISDSVQGMKHVSQANTDVLAALFNTLSLIDFLDTLEVLLQRPNNELQRKVLRLLEGRLRQHPERDSPSQIRMLDFLPMLVGTIKSSSDILLKHAAVACVDRIADKYGRKDPSKVIPAAKVVASEACIGQDDDRIRIMGVLCLASMAEVLGQAMIPALPEALSRSMSLLEMSLEKGKENSRLHDAAFSLFSAMFAHLPFMITAGHLDKIMLLSFKSTNSNLEEDSADSRQEALRLMARKVDLRVTLGAVDRNWNHAVEAGPAATKEILEVISLTIEKHPKSATMKNISTLSNILFKAFDLRREQAALGQAAFDESDLDDAEDMINDVAIKMIYKLNDTTFRPIFTELLEWATGLSKKDTQGGLARLTTFYKFLQVFFGTLQSIVTGYASYVLENVVSVLETTSPASDTNKPLWLATMRMLRNAFEHDQDEFWQSPSHLNAISKPLISQLSHAKSKPTASLVIAEAVPTITELAVAADSTDNHKELNSALMRYLRPATGPTAASTAGGENPHTRLAALKAEQALTEQLGEEWLALLPEMLPYISELMEDEDEDVEREVRRWVKQIEDVLGEKLDDMLT